jgi:hypothetical protein
VFQEFNAEDRIISKGLRPPRSPNLNPCGFQLLKSVVHANNPHDLEAIKQNICEAIYTSGSMKCNKFPEICLKEFRHVSQQNIFYGGEYKINYYI